MAKLPLKHDALDAHELILREIDQMPAVSYAELDEDADQDAELWFDDGEPRVQTPSSALRGRKYRGRS